MKQSPQQGYTLVPAIFMLGLLALLTYFINADGVANLNLAKQQNESQRARYIAEAGLSHAVVYVCGGSDTEDVIISAGLW